MDALEKETLCRELFQRLLAALDADHASAAEMHDYLRDCEPCTEFVESIERTRIFCRQAARDGERVLGEDAIQKLRAAFLLQQDQ